ncbi:MAG TPA: acyl-CoA dehydrogenase family protein [Vicinamibacterales bacterium]|nr:acyl-CoA dehydrogenase family protein [Vicinamibacterales bacterium]
MTTAAGRRGGDWLVRTTGPAEVFSPETTSEEHRLIAQLAAEFVTKEVEPALPDLEEKRWDVARRLVLRAGELGLLGTDVPEKHGGAGLDKAASVIATEAVGACPSFATTFGGQTGLALIPILCFGTPEQQAKYLPGILSGETVGAYCLSESVSGSDALGARARATRETDGSWRLNGEKLWVTNGGFADVFIVFAKVDGEHFSAFIVEHGFPGVTRGQEEHKMGLQGSSTTPLLLADAVVPAANLLGQVGKGHKIAFNVLNYGRLKLAAMCTGGARPALAEAVTYALTRRQFGQPLASFGAIQDKFAEMSLRFYGAESMLYRVTGLVDRSIEATSGDEAAVAGVFEEFALEASLVKVAASEMVDFVVDENVQIHGGNGFVRDYPAERRFRDARVNRIFEGTNEINRLLIPGVLVKRAKSGALPLFDRIAEARGDRDTARPTDGPLGTERDVAAALKEVALVMLGLAIERHGDGLAREQEVLMALSDLIIEAFAAESVVLRAAARAAEATADLHADMARVYALDSALRARGRAVTLAGALESADTASDVIAHIDALLPARAVDTLTSRRRIAQAAIDRRRYPFP